MVVIYVVLFLSVVIGVSCQDDAILKMEYTTDDNEPNRIPLELYGNFSPAGPRKAAEGNLFQMHPASFCDVDEVDNLREMVVVMKLEPPDNMPCVAITLYIKAKRAIKMGAEAIIFITTENPEASKKLEKDAEAKKILDQPIVIIQGREGQKIMKLVQSQVAARATLEYNENVLLSSVSTPSSKPYLIANSTNQFFNMSIFVAVFVLFAIVCLLVLLKFMWRQRARQTTTTQLAQNMLSQMKVRKYKRLDQHQRQYGTGCRSVSTLSDGLLCAICLEDFKDGEDIRVVPCGHEFHRRCVDPWLLSNKTCPLCMYNIMELSTDAHLCMAPNTVPDQQIDRNYVHSVRLSAALQRRQNLYSSVAPSGTEQRQSWPGYGRHRSHRRTYSSPRRNANHYNEQNATQNDTRVDMTRSSNLCRRCENHQAVMTRSRTKQNTYRQTNSRHNGDRQYVQLPKISNSQSFLQYEALATQLPTGPQYVNPRDQIVHDYLYFYEDCPSDLRETTSLSSLTPSAFHADWEFSDSSRNSGNWDNFDSNQSIYGSCVSLRSDPTPPDPLVYCRPESLLPFQDFENSVQLLPKCVHRTKRYHSNVKKVDSDESKKSSESKVTDISLKVNVSQEGNKRSQRQIAAEKRFTEAATEYEPCLKCAYRRIKRLHEEYTGLGKHSPKHFHRNRYKKTHRSPEKACNHRTMPYAGHLTNCRRKSGTRTKGASKRVHRPGRSQCSPKKSVGDTLPDRSNIVQSVAVCESERGKVQMLPVHRGTRHLLEALV